MAFTTRPELRGTFGAVATTHWLASATGMGVLERGGNAFDAAVAAGFVLQVGEPHLTGPGGEAPILGCRPGDAGPGRRGGRTDGGRAREGSCRPRSTGTARRSRRPTEPAAATPAMST